MERFETLLGILLVIVLSWSLMLQVSAEEDGSKTVAVTLTPDNKNVIMDEFAGVKIQVENLNTPNDITVRDAILILPNGWITGSEPEGSRIIAANSSGILAATFKVPRSSQEGTYAIFVRIVIEESGKTSSIVAKTDITVKPPMSLNLANVNWDDITLLMSIYSIPGLAIERMVEFMLGILWNSTTAKKEGESRWVKWLGDEARIKGLDHVLKKMEGAIPDSGREEFVAQYIGYYKLKALLYYKRIGGVYIIASIFATPPATFLSLYGLGMLQILGVPKDPLVLFLDVLTGIVAITFLTKPTHEVIKLLEKLRGYKAGGKVSDE